MGVVRKMLMLFALLVGSFATVIPRLECSCHNPDQNHRYPYVLYKWQHVQFDRQLPTAGVYALDQRDSTDSYMDHPLSKITIRDSTGESFSYVSRTMMKSGFKAYCVLASETGLEVNPIQNCDLFYSQPHATNNVFLLPLLAVFMLFSLAGLIIARRIRSQRQAESEFQLTNVADVSVTQTQPQ